MTRRPKSATIVDTNVAVGANGEATATPACVSRCARALEALMQSGRIAIDDGWRIIGEYRANLHTRGQPGAGDSFLKWVLTNQGNRNRCTQVPITAMDVNGEDYVEFPKDPDLEGFDPADRKFVAVAKAIDGPAQIVEALDTGWWKFREALGSAGVAVKFICHEDIRAKYEQRTARR